MNPIEVAARRVDVVTCAKQAIDLAGTLSGHEQAALMRAASTTIAFDNGFKDNGNGGCLATQAGLTQPGNPHTDILPFALTFDRLLQRRYPGYSTVFPTVVTVTA